MHLDLGCNQITQDGAAHLFNQLKKHKSLTSISLGNMDCYKNKNKIGVKGCKALSDLLRTNPLISMINLADNAVSGEGLKLLVEGIRDSPSLISLNL